MVNEYKMQGMLASLEKEGRGGDSEIGFIEPNSVVIPVGMMQDEDVKEVIDSVKEAIKMQRQDPKRFTVTPQNTDYSYDKDSAIPAHLTMGEFIIPVQVMNVVPELDQGMRELFEAFEVPYNRFVVGHPDNSINPDTGYPEFFLKKIKRSIKKAVKKITKGIKTGIKSVVDFGKNFVKGLGQGFSDLLEGDIKAVLRNPAVVATASFFAPSYAAYINLGAKAATGQKIETSDLVSAGFSASTDFSKIKIDPNVKKAVTAAAKISEGQDPLKALAGTYGNNFAEQLGLDRKVNQTLAGLGGQQFADRVTNNFDINRAAADLASGNSAQRILANQYGDELVSLIGAKSPTQQALGFAGIESVLQKSEGASDQDALLAGAETYYDRGGALPDIRELASAGNIDLPNINLGSSDFIKGLYTNTLGRLPDLPDAPDLSFIEDYARQYAPQIGSLDFKGLNLSAPELFNSNIDLGLLDFGGVRLTDIEGVNLGNLNDFGLSLPDLNDLNIDFDFELGTLAAIDDLQKTKIEDENEDEFAKITEEDALADTERSLARELLGMEQTRAVRQAQEKRLTFT